MNLTSRAAMTLVVKRKAMQATTTKMLYKLWKKFYLNYCPEDSKERIRCQVKEDEEGEEEQEENKHVNFEELQEVEHITLVMEENQKPCSSLEPTKSFPINKEIRWEGIPNGVTCFGEDLFSRAIVCRCAVSVSSVLVVQMLRGSLTVLGNAANVNELFLTNKCIEFELGEVKHTKDVGVHPCSSTMWSFDTWEEAVQREVRKMSLEDYLKAYQLMGEYYRKGLYWPDRGAFFHLSYDTMGLGNGICHSCKIKETQKEKEIFKVDWSKLSFMYNVYYSERIYNVPVVTVEGKCQVRMMDDCPSLVPPAIFEHIFFCKRSYNLAKRILNQVA
ncbi:hypothetical protein HHK36_025391 [Tetracentron sinense]|uniref:Uncharacterized protein n=1 Tax=Tetracentron sinense TaxID=13715 RepID=A0A835D3I5_TETSI|nr:hypothetical protein HHK36_025391 [Tetracentron sinense]